MAGKVKLGISLFSLTPLFVTRQWDLERCLKEVHEMGYEGIEVVAAQMVPNYPYPSDEWIQDFKGLLKKYELTLVTWSAYIDMGIRADRDLTEEEIIQYTRNDMIYAKKAGAQMVRTQHAISPKIYKRMLPFCKEIGVKLVIEMHSPHHPEVDVWKEYLEIMRDPASEGYFGVVPDFGIFQFTPHKIAIDSYLEGGCRKEALDKIIMEHESGRSLEEIINAGDYTEYEKGVIADIKHKFSAPAKVGDLAKLLSCTPYIHGKFHYLEKNCEDSTIPYGELMESIKNSGFEGYIACEYEGHRFDIDPKEQINRFAIMIDKMLK
ncbi:MAG TPA: TIM barrel protein [Clostridiales bacterium]|nr:TIM barrel protein [Clostridiales bacterium]